VVKEMINERTEAWIVDYRAARVRAIAAREETP
jgi:hypothetical protein